MPVDVTVVGQVARDLVLLVHEIPRPGEAVQVRSRREMLGGKGANLAVALAQLDVDVALLGVVGDDSAGDWLVERARADRVSVTPVVRREHTRSALIVDLLTEDGRWRYLEDVPHGAQVTEADVASAASVLTGSAWVVVQLQQPGPAALAAARCARVAGRRVVLDGAPPTEWRDALLANADVLRADRREAEHLTGQRLDGAADAMRAARRLLASGPSLVALEVKDGNVFVWEDDSLFLPLVDTTVADTTGGGDAFTAALTAGLLRGAEPARAARLAVAAAASTVERPGGRPELTATAIETHLARLDETLGDAQHPVRR